MKKFYIYLFAMMVMMFFSVQSIWAAYVKFTSEDGIVSWIEIKGQITGTNFEVYYEKDIGYTMPNWVKSRAVELPSRGSIDLNEVWSGQGGTGTHYQVTSIGENAFIDCYGLISITIPSGITNIYFGNSAFQGCNNLISINIPKGVKCGFGERTFEGCKSLESFTIPEGQYSIPYRAFCGCTSLSEINIPSSVTSIGDYAFASCSKLTEITIPSSVTEIGYSAFSYCSGLTSVTSYITNVFATGAYSFNGCENATLYVPKGLINTYQSKSGWGYFGKIKEIPDVAYIKVTNLDGTVSWESIFGTIDETDFVIYKDEGQRTIDKHINGSIDLNEVWSESGGFGLHYHVSSIGNSAFYGCASLKDIIISESITSIEDSAFLNCKGLSSITIPSSVSSIGTSAFKDCTNLNSITIPSSMTSIGGSIFWGCTGLNSITIPSSVTNIGNSTFQNCSGLIEITIPSSVTSIGERAFSGCLGVTSVITEITNIFETGDYAFDVGSNATTLYVPKGLVETYRLTKDWNRLRWIEEISALSSSIILSCNNMGKILVNDDIEFTNDVDEVIIMDGKDNSFEFIPDNNCQLEQVLLDGLDVSLSVKNNQLTTKIRENTKMIVTFSKQGDINSDGRVDISDVVALVNKLITQP